MNKSILVVSLKIPMSSLRESADFVAEVIEIVCVLRNGAISAKHLDLKNEWDISAKFESVRVLARFAAKA